MREISQNSSSSLQSLKTSTKIVTPPRHKTFQGYRVTVQRSQSCSPASTRQSCQKAGQVPASKLPSVWSSPSWYSYAMKIKWWPVYLQIPGIRGSDADSPSVFLHARRSLARLHLLLNRSSPSNQPVVTKIFPARQFWFTQRDWVWMALHIVENLALPLHTCAVHRGQFYNLQNWGSLNHCTMQPSIAIGSWIFFESNCLVCAHFWSKWDKIFLTGVKP